MIELSKEENVAKNSFIARIYDKTIQALFSASPPNLTSPFKISPNLQSQLIEINQEMIYGNASIYQKKFIQAKVSHVHDLIAPNQVRDFNKILDHYIHFVKFPDIIKPSK